MEHPGPVVIDFRVKYDENCYPMVPPGASLYETIDNPVRATEREPVLSGAEGKVAV